jgi:hypothetical protein
LHPSHSWHARWSLLDARTVLYQTYLKLDSAVKAVVRTDPVCRRLMTSRRASMTRIASAAYAPWRRTSV